MKPCNATVSNDKRIDCKINFFLKNLKKKTRKKQENCIYADFIHIEAAWVPYLDLHEAGLVPKHVPSIPSDF